ncbi:MAG TPA: hypothetical protein VEA59_06105, partial [Patescibacteria group bacterium]|nr:hypothetical protein [Patescibacteria group bacterium]
KIYYGNSNSYPAGSTPLITVPATPTNYTVTAPAPSTTARYYFVTTVAGAFESVEAAKTVSAIAGGNPCAVEIPPTAYSSFELNPFCDANDPDMTRAEVIFVPDSDPRITAYTIYRSNTGAAGTWSALTTIPRSFVESHLTNGKYRHEDNLSITSQTWYAVSKVWTSASSGPGQTTPQIGKDVNKSASCKGTPDLGGSDKLITSLGSKAEDVSSILCKGASKTQLVAAASGQFYKDDEIEYTIHICNYGNVDIKPGNTAAKPPLVVSDRLIDMYLLSSTPIVSGTDHGTPIFTREAPDANGNYRGFNLKFTNGTLRKRNGVSGPPGIWTVKFRVKIALQNPTDEDYTMQNKACLYLDLESTSICEAGRLKVATDGKHVDLTSGAVKYTNNTRTPVKEEKRPN